MFGEPIPRHTTLRLSQRFLSSAGVVVYFDIRCAIQQRFIESFSFFAPLSTFVKYLSSSETSSNPPTYPWSTWGPNGALLCMKTRPDGLSLDNMADKPYVDGRTVYISGFRAVLNQGTEIMDFNPYHLSKVLSGKPLPPGAEIVKSPTHVHSRTFASRVTTTLPYMKMTLPAVERLLDDQRVSRHLEWYRYSRRLFFQDRNGLKMLCLNPQRLDESEIMESAEIYSL
ncbi:hypothetical protein K474DRAFT_98577 [Panus rudis PR-1116 ss-1]|nr:hypothetical protein K474DRAFT_98577 [Panus rudis PR-1116 ss-1]